MTLVYIGLGSNLGDSLQTMQWAVSQLAALGQVERVSALYGSKPMGPQDQPDYMNAAVALKTALSPLALLDQLQHLERESGRVKLRHWGERTLDLDILLYGDEQIQSERLTVPHSGILLRQFVVLPLLDLNPELQVAGQSLKSCEAAKMDDTIHRIAANWLS